MVNFLSMFCPRLQKLFKSIYDLTSKVRQLIWGKDQQIAFEEIKHRFIKPLVLHLPIVQVDFTYIQTQVNLLWEVHYIKYRMDNQS